MADLLELQINRPEIVALAFADGREYPSKIAGAPPQVMFTLVDGRRVFWPQPFAATLRAAGIGANTPFEVEKKEIAKGRTQLQFRSLANPAAPMPTMRAAAESQEIQEIQHKQQLLSHPTPAPATRLWTAPPERPAQERPAITPQTAKLCASMCSLIDAMAEAKSYAVRCGLELSSEDLRCLAVTAYIQESKGGAR